MGINLGSFLPDLVAWQWALIAFSAFGIGMAKTGVPGLGILAVPLAVLAVGDARKSSGWLLPLLILADILAVWIYRKNPSARAVFGLAQWVLGGMVVGALVLSYPEAVIRPIVGVILMVILTLFLLRRRGIDLTPHGAPWTAGVYGTSAGFASMVANAAGPVMNVYLLSRNLPRQDFVAASAWFFFFINLSKVPVFAWQGMIDATSLRGDLVLIPAVLAGAFTGRKVLLIMPEKVFIATVTVLAFVATLLLFVPK
jgi:uncharacterized membrane protein YfcA